MVLGENIHTTENADKGTTSSCAELALGVLFPALILKRTIVNTMVPSSHPNWPPQQRNRAAIRRKNANAATASPAIPETDTTLVRSRTGAWHAVRVTFFVAEGL